MLLTTAGTPVTSASHLKLASDCEFAFLRMLDYRPGRIEGVPVVDNPMLAKAEELGGLLNQFDTHLFMSPYFVASAGAGTDKTSIEGVEA